MKKKKKKRAPQLNPDTVKRAKESSAYGWAVWCDYNHDFHRKDSAVRVFADAATARAALENAGDWHMCDMAVRVKIIVED